MAGLPGVPKAESYRTRRWDAVVLGTALPGLVAAVRLGMNGHRVLILEEEAAGRVFPGLREPFLMNGAESGGILAECLRELGFALIDRRRIEPERLAYQVVLPDARIDIGEPAWTTEELSAWKLTSPDAARRMVRSLRDAAAAERDAMLAAPVVRGWRRVPLASRRTALPAASGRPRAPARHERGLPPEVAEAPRSLVPLLAAQVRALSNLGGARPSPEARARLLGVGLEGGAFYSGGRAGLRNLLRRRVEALHGEFRAVPDSFHLVSVANQPGVAFEGYEEILVGRALVLNANRSCLAEAVDQDPVPDLLSASPPTRRRIALHFRAARRVLPEGIGARVICVGDPGGPMDGTNVVSVRVIEGRDPEFVDLVAAAAVRADDDYAARGREIEACVARLMPFSAGGIVRERHRRPRWDGDDWLCDPPKGAGWPADTEVRLASRPPAYVLDRAGVAGLGFEGDLLLGWRAGDAIAADLA